MFRRPFSRLLCKNKTTSIYSFQLRHLNMSTPAAPTPAQPNSFRPPKRPFSGTKFSKAKKPKKQEIYRSEGSHDEVLAFDVEDLQNRTANISIAEDALPPTLPAPFTEIDVEIAEISSTGDGLGFLPGSKHVYVVPFSSPGDVVRAKVIRHMREWDYSVTDFLSVTKPSQARDDGLIKCPYFASCSGCQFQMLPYSVQLAHKKTIVEKAYKNFSGLPKGVVPEVQDTMGSPLQYGYRTKLTPHFDGPQGGRRAKRAGDVPKFETVPPIGYMKKGTRRTLDIEECPIGTAAVQMGLRRERKRVTEEIGKYRKGATILLRESTERIEKGGEDAIQQPSGLDEANEVFYDHRDSHVYARTCISDPSATAVEYIGEHIFKNSANAFFQNNNSILPDFTVYVRDHILPRDPVASDPPITNLIDAYSGSGLFTITLASLFKRSVGIDIDTSSIAAARRNAQLNGLTDESSGTTTAAGTPRVQFMAADAATLFEGVLADFVPEQTAVVIDPPRKGCDEAFLRQLLAFGPARVVYVSCNVHTQARDIGWLLRGGNDAGADAAADDDVAAVLQDGKYEIESLRGFDFFPQTGHVEGVAVLRRKDMSGRPATGGDVTEQIGAEVSEHKSITHDMDEGSVKTAGAEPVPS